MTANKHTPWAVMPHDCNEYGLLDVCSFAIERADGLQVATVVSDCIEEHEDNARLIAAAPELLEALTGLVAAYEALGEAVGRDGSWHSHALAAISKATGGAA